MDPKHRGKYKVLQNQIDKYYFDIEVLDKRDKYNEILPFLKAVHISVPLFCYC